MSILWGVKNDWFLRLPID